MERCELCGNELAELGPDEKHPWRERFCLLCQDRKVERFEVATGEQLNVEAPKVPKVDAPKLEAMVSPLKALGEGLGPGGTKMMLGLLGVLLGDEKTGHRLLAEAVYERCDATIKKGE